MDDLRGAERNDVTGNSLNQLLAALVGSDGIDSVADPFDNRDAVQDFGQRVDEMEVAIKRLSAPRRS